MLNSPIVAPLPPIEWSTLPPELETFFQVASDIVASVAERAPAADDLSVFAFAFAETTEPQPLVA